VFSTGLNRIEPIDLKRANKAAPTKVFDHDDKGIRYIVKFFIRATELLFNYILLICIFLYKIKLSSYKEFI